MKNYFVIEENPSGRGFFIVWNHTVYPRAIERGSFGVIPARVLGITFANYLRLCRDEFGATIYGKKSLYPVPYYKTYESADKARKFFSSFIA